MPKKIIPGAEPFYLKTDSKVACLLVHGFTSTTYDVRACGEYLSAHGITTKGVLVAGHGTSPKELAKTSLDDWLNSVREAYQELKKDYPVVYALGISLGGNFLITLAKEFDLAGLVFIGVPLKFKHEKSYKALYYAYRALGINYQRKWYQKSLDPAIREVRPNYKSIPLVSAPEVLKAIEMSRVNLPMVKCPVLAVQSTTDHAVDEETITTLQSSISSKDFEVMWVENRYHVVLIDHGKEEVFKRVLQFIEDHQKTK